MGPDLQGGRQWSSRPPQSPVGVALHGKSPQVHARRSHFLAIALNASRLLTKAGGAGFKMGLKKFVRGMV